MTLVSITTNFGHPIIIGDILSSSEEAEVELEIPVFLKGINKYLPEDKILKPKGYNQKVYVINELLAVALAGSSYEMKLFLEDLKNNFTYRDINIKELDEFLALYDYEQFNRSSAGIILADKNSEAFVFHKRFIGKWKRKDDYNFEQIMACGSGSEDFIRMATEMQDTELGNAKSLYWAIASNYLLLAKVFANEKYELGTIINNWGTGFELIYFEGTKFVKMDDVTYIFWKANIDLQSGKYIDSPDITLNFKYYGDILGITSINEEKVGGYGVLPLYTRLDEVNHEKLPTKPHIDGKRICNIYSIMLSNGAVRNMIFFSERIENPDINNLRNEQAASYAGQVIAGAPRNGQVRVFFDKEGRFTIMIDKEITNEIFRCMEIYVSSKYGLSGFKVEE